MNENQGAAGHERERERKKNQLGSEGEVERGGERSGGKRRERGRERGELR